MVIRGASRVPKLIARATSGRGGQAFTERMAREIGKLPRELWPIIQSHWSDQKCFDTTARYLKGLPESAGAVFQEAGKLDVPLIVISAGDSSPEQRSDHERMARLSSRGRMETVEGGHWILLDQPDLVIDSIREILQHVQQPR